MPNPHIQTYLAEVNSTLASGRATEHSYRPALQKLIEALYPKIKAINEQKRISVGAPDFILLDGQTPMGYIETKDVGLDLDNKDTQKQTTRYVDGLGNVILTDYLEFRWYEGDTKKPRYSVTLAKKEGKKLVSENRDDEFLSLFQQFLASDVKTVKTAKELASAWQIWQRSFAILSAML